MPDPKCKYPSYEALAEAFSSGELDPDKYVLVLDNDDCHLSWLGDEDAPENDWEYLTGLFRGHGYSDLMDAVSALGIPCEGA